MDWPGGQLGLACRSWKAKDAFGSYAFGGPAFGLWSGGAGLCIAPGAARQSRERREAKGTSVIVKDIPSSPHQVIPRLKPKLSNQCDASWIPG